MKLEHDFRVALPLDDAWHLLTDLPRIAGCLPGAHLDETVDGEHRGGLSTKIGPITARYRGGASFVERDEVAHRAVIAARGREERGGGTAAATITAQLSPDGAGTRVDVATELAITGRAAQFGRSLLSEVSASLLTEFVTRLEALAAGSADTPAGADRPVPGVSAVSEAPRRTVAAGAPKAGGDDNVLDARLIIGPLLRRAALPAGVALAAAACGYALGRGHHAA